jgi:hypothetical protein
LAVGVLLLASLCVRADDQADITALLDKAIKAHGGEEKLSKLKGSTIKGKGKFYGFGDALDFTSEAAHQSPDKSRELIKSNLMGQDFTMLQVFAGGKGWITMNGDTQELSDDQLAEGKVNLYAEWIRQLYPLKDKEFKLAKVADIKVGANDAAGIKVSRKDYPDVNLYFDKKTGLLVQRTMKVKDMQSGDQVEEVVVYDDYKDADGIKYAAKGTISRGGKKYVEVEVLEVKHSEKLDDKLFAKP